MNSFATHLATFATAGAIFACAAIQTAPAEPTAIRVGTFDSRAIAVAHTNSEHFRSVMREIETDLDEARTAGDTDEVARIEALMPAMQHDLHLQAFATAPVHGLLEAIDDEIPRVAQEAGVEMIVSKWEVIHLADHAVTVDVTDRLVALFEPDERALGWIEDLEDVEPMDAADLDHDH